MDFNNLMYFKMKYISFYLLYVMYISKFLSNYTDFYIFPTYYAIQMLKFEV